HTTSEAVVRGVIGEPVQLPCIYSVNKDVFNMCWGRGPCPKSKCNGKILHTTGNRVTFRKSQRYNLQGYISYGDVSLTIAEVKEEDAGTYCCRIEVPGWFNDIKHDMRLEVTTAPPMTTTNTRKAPVSPKQFRKTTFAPQANSDHQTTAETAVLLTATVPETTSATTESLAGITLETITLSSFAVKENDIFPETIVTTSATPDFSTGFQTADMRTEDDYIFCSTESASLPGVTTELPSMFLTAEGTESVDSSVMVEDVQTADPSIPHPIYSNTVRDGDSTTSLGSPFHRLTTLSVQNFFLIYAILIACLVVLSILFILMLSFWKRKHTNKFIIKSLRPVEDPEKVFNHAEGENSMFSL
ncbi:HAVR1 protein, partial [Jacana jacana]|nr:HAVR1 protein [Jacana jacana]